MVVFTPKPEATNGLRRPSEESLPELEDADTSNISPERRRMDTEMEPKPKYPKNQK